MTLSTVGDLFSIGGGGRPRTYVVDDKIVHVWSVAVKSGEGYYDPVGARMQFTVLDKSGAVVTPPTFLGDHLNFDDQKAGFEQNVYHVSANAKGNLVFHVSESANGYGGWGGEPHVPYTEHRATITVNANGKPGDPVEVVTDDFIKFELSDTADLSNGKIALLLQDGRGNPPILQILNNDGSIASTNVIDATIDTSPIFGQGAGGIEVIQVGARILVLHRDALGDDLYGHFFNLDGSENAAEFQISKGDHDNQSMAAVWQNGVIDATVLADDRVAIVWADAKTGSDGTEVWLTILNPNGSVSLSETLANVNHTAGEQYHPRVHALDDGGFIVTFDQNYAPATDPRSFAQQFDADGKPVGDLLEMGAGTSSTGGSGYGYIYSDGTGFMIDWYGNVQEISTGGGGGNPFEGTNGRDKYTGTPGADVMTGKGGNDMLKGLGGKDDLSGDGGADRLYGGGGRDKLDGGAGRDRLDGGKGNDVLTGGGGPDKFVFANKGGRDTIRDFQDNVDTILLDDALWGGGLSVKQVLKQFGSVVDGDVVLDFGKHELTIDGLDDLAALRNDIDIF